MDNSDSDICYPLGEVTSQNLRLQNDRRFVDNVSAGLRCVLFVLQH